MHTMNKVAKVTLLFWIMKICATTLGETGGDLLSMTMNVGYAVSSLILITFFFLTLVGQLKTDRFIPFSTGSSSFRPARQARRCRILWTALLDLDMLPGL